MAKTIEQILGYVQLCGVIQSTKTGLPKPLPEGFYKKTDATIGDEGRYTQVTGTRQTALQVMYGAPSRKRKLKDVASKDVKLLHNYEHIDLPVLLLEKLRNYATPEHQQHGIDEVNRQIAEFGQLFDNFETAAVNLALGTGTIYFDSNGNLLPSSSSSAFGVDYGVPSGNQNQLDVFGGGAIISATWATASNDIPLQLRNLKKAAVKKSGYPLKYAIYGENITSYLQKNDYVKDWFTRHPMKREQFMDTGEMPDGMLGFTWIPAYTAFFEDQNESFQDIWAADKIVFTPEPSPDWWGIMQGTYGVPTTINIQGSGLEAINSVKHTKGMFAYAQVTNDPVGVRAYAGNTFLPILKVPGAIYIADVTP